jgi:hypothetical protein
MTNENMALGRRSPSGRPVLRLASFLRSSEAQLAIPPTADHFGRVVYGLDRNNEFGTCGPTSLDNLGRLLSSALGGLQKNASWADVKTLYMRQNPQFDENDPGGPGDAGVDMNLMLTHAVKYGFGPFEILGFAEVDVTNEAEIQAAIATFGGMLDGVTLQTAQQSSGHFWDYVAGSDIWGGHAVMNAKYDLDSDDVISWEEQYMMTRSFTKRQREEAYVVIFREHLGVKQFLENIDVWKLADEYTALTGRPFPAVLPVKPLPPSPTPQPPSPAPTPAPGAASFLGATATVDRHILHAATSAKMSVTDYMNRHWSHYFKIQEMQGDSE